MIKSQINLRNGHAYNTVLLTELSSSLGSLYHFQVWIKIRDPLNGNICGIGVNGDIFPLFACSCDMYIVVEKYAKLLVGCLP